MFTPKLSVIIPSRNIPSWPYLQKTIDNLFDNASENIEVIVILDGFVPDPPIRFQKHLTLLPQKESIGMRQGINLGVSVAKGKYVMKTDDHCVFSPGYDKALTSNCEDNWLVVPSRYSLDANSWLAGENDFKKITKYGPINYDFLTYPYKIDEQFGYGLRGKKWKGERGYTGGYFDREKKLKHLPIDDIIAFQGSCWFMSKSNFERIGGMQIEGFGAFSQEAQELLFKTVLSGGRAVVNKRASYAHLHKNEATGGRGYHLLKHQIIQSQIYSTDLWMNNKWPGQIMTFKKWIENPHWWPLETWPEDWDNQEFIKNYDYNLWMRK